MSVEDKTDILMFIFLYIWINKTVKKCQKTASELFFLTGIKPVIDLTIFSAVIHLGMFLVQSRTKLNPCLGNQPIISLKSRGLRSKADRSDLCVVASVIVWLQCVCSFSVEQVEQAETATGLSNYVACRDFEIPCVCFVCVCAVEAIYTDTSSVTLSSLQG